MNLIQATVYFNIAFTLDLIRIQPAPDVIFTKLLVVILSRNLYVFEATIAAETELQK